MRKLTVFNQETLDGYFSGVNGDLSWAHNARPDPEWDAFAGDNAASGGVLLFGRVTYEMMVSYWPTPKAMKDNPGVAEGMNSLPKIVFSKTLDKVTWNNTKLVKSDPAGEVRKLKKEPGKDLVVLGSGTIVSQLTQEGLVDEYNIVLFPIVLGEGKTMFEGLKKKVALKLASQRTFGNGNILLRYHAA